MIADHTTCERSNTRQADEIADFRVLGGLTRLRTTNLERSQPVPSVPTGRNPVSSCPQVETQRDF